MKSINKLAALLTATIVLALVLFATSFAQHAAVTAGLEPVHVKAPAATSITPAAGGKDLPGAAPAQFTEALLEQIGGAKVALDTMWTLIAGMLVFFMNLGFASVESGLCRAKNTVTILAKNFVVFAAASIAFLVLGWGLMFGDGNPFFGTQGLWFVGGEDNSPAIGDAYKGVYSSINWTGVPLWTKFFFQLVFAGTAATIVSGAVAERIKFSAFYIFSFWMVGLIYPVVGHWIWGGGWAAKLGMFDFAGSTVVHSVGGWAALTGAMVLGPRLGKYSKEGKVLPLPGHSIALATIGVFVLWFGWFGFNPGSTMAADAGAIGRIAVSTNTAAAAAAISASITAWLLLGKPDLTMILNGSLAGLVAITAPCAFVSIPSALIIGAMAGVLVVVSVLFFDKIKIDDPVGATSVHLVCGIFGTICVGLFAQDQFSPNTTGNGLFFGGGAKLLFAQLAGIVGVGAFVFTTSLIVWNIIKATIGVRVSAEEEVEGLDIGEHGNMAYPDFVTVTARGSSLITEREKLTGAPAGYAAAELSKGTIS
ncbi:MAG TPA: ammonium transporter [Pyrinomonadaceae bacterium]|nr:ammonium transporter [Pyrinomonadaceae bacterium]